MGGPYQECNSYYFDGVRVGECDQFDLGEITSDTLSKTAIQYSTRFRKKEPQPRSS
jgi:hypothetical protein